jgi:hypothetical protein
MITKIDWTKLESQHPKELVEELKKLYDRGSFEVTASEFIQDLIEYSEAEALELLSDAVEMGYLEKKVKYFCPFGVCGLVLTKDEAKGESCSHCERFFCDSDEEIRSDLYFIWHGPSTRIVRWFLALHGMNTRGTWQEEFTWRVSTTFKRSIPVAIYKYGIIRSGAIVKWRQKQLMKRMIEKLKYFSSETTSEGFGGIPDIIAHSFGTWLLGHALEKDKSLKVGRVILTGCILRPDFNWTELLKNGKVEAVLNHYGTKDFWANIAHYIIPDSGPSGRRGFDDDRVINKKAIDQKHRDFFKQKNMGENFTKIWWPFLQTDKSLLNESIQNEKEASTWKETKWLFRATLLRFLIILIALGGVGFLLISLIEGIFNFKIF